jgi:hypothetical protein
MTDPLTIGAAGLSLAGGAVGAMGALSAGEGSAAAARFNQQIALNNIGQAREAATAGAERIRYGGARMIGAQKAGYAAAGVDVGSGSPLDVMGDTASQLKLAELVKLYEGDVAATEAGNKASIAGATGRAAQTAAGYSAAGSLLGGAAGGLKGWERIFGPEPMPAGSGIGSNPGPGTGGLY